MKLSGSPTHNAQKGFTLIELMIVVGIMGMIMAIGLPSFVQVFGHKAPMPQAVSDVMEACRQARAAAIFSGKTYEVAFILENGSFQSRPSTLMEAPSLEGASARNAADLPSETRADSPQSRKIGDFSAHLHPDIKIELLDINLVPMIDQAEARARFFPNGTSDDFAIVLSSSEGEVRQISLEVLTGLASMEVVE